MPSNREMVQILKGNLAGKVNLFEYFLTKIGEGSPLNEGEIPVFKTLQLQILGQIDYETDPAPESIIVEMSASLEGSSGVNGGG